MSPALPRYPATIKRVVAVHRTLLKDLARIIPRTTEDRTQNLQKNPRSVQVSKSIEKRVS